jgi:diadenosine tetraphosphate (Ap4A) HIT family hydrolase
MYDSSNVFAKILRGEIPCKTIYEDTFALAFHDIRPEAPSHALVIPKGEYVSFADFSARAEASFMHGFFQAVRATAEALGLHASGYRLITNHGADASQSVAHFHVHILGGKPLGGLLP